MECRRISKDLSINKNKSQFGFTLIELLTVVLLISVVSGFAAFSLSGDPHRTMETFAKRFTLQFELLTEESAFSGNDFGLLIENDSYRYVVWDQVTWRAPRDSGLAKAQVFPDTIDVDLFLDEESILSLIAETSFLETSDEQAGFEEKISPPQILILSSGEVTPFSLLLEDRSSDQVLRVDIDALGRTVVERSE